MSSDQGVLAQDNGSGWWGLISFFANIAIIVADVCTLIAYKRVPEPVQFGQPLPPAQTPGKPDMPVMRRFDGSALPTPF